MSAPGDAWSEGFLSTDDMDRLASARAEARLLALEEAARVCDRFEDTEHEDVTATLAARIRALATTKGTP